VRALSLFSGIGGFDIGFGRAGIKTVAFAENDKWAAQVLRRHWPATPNLGDVRDVVRFAGEMVECPDGCGEAWCEQHEQHFFECPCTGAMEFLDEIGQIDIIHGGFPCQDLSVAGQRAGLGGDRSNLWFEFQRILSVLRPRWCVIENVPGLLSSNEGRDFAVLLESLGDCGFDGIGWGVLDAQHFGVPQRRRRVFIVGGPSRQSVEAVLSICEGCDGNPETGEEAREGIAGTLGGSSQTGGFRTTDLDNQGAFITGAVSAKWHKGSGGPAGDEAYNLLTAPTLTAADPSAPPRDGKRQDGARYDRLPMVETTGVRRLTPMECERLMGWPDDWTRWDSQGNEIADSHRYRMCGNGVVATVAEWIGRRIRVENG
jgi:DNA (cytosine-5)-methyltransferase 1